MKYLVVICGFTLMAAGYKQHRKSLFKIFQFDFHNTKANGFVISFTQNDTVFIRTYMYYHSNYDTLKGAVTYFGLLSNNQRKTLDSFICRINYSRLYNVYYENYKDEIEYQQFFLKNDSIEKFIDIYNNPSKKLSLDTLYKYHISEGLRTLSKWIIETKEKIQWHEVNNDTIVFYEQEW